MTVVLCGGGPDTVTDPGLLRPFTEQVAGGRVAVVLDDGSGVARHFLPEYLRLLGPAATGAVPVLLPEDATETLGEVAAIVVGGGVTPSYHRHLERSFPVIGDRVRRGVPYLGFSAGAMIAGTHAVLGGWRSGGVPVCPQEWSEGLEDVVVRPGIGLVDGAVDVHGPQAGILGRAVAVVDAGLAPRVAVVAEDTALVDGVPRGRGPVWEVVPHPDGALVRTLPAIP